MKIYDEYANVLRDMYSLRFNGGASSQGTSTQVQSALHETTPPSVINTLEAWNPTTKLGNARTERRRSEFN